MRDVDAEWVADAHWEDTRLKRRQRDGKGEIHCRAWLISSHDCQLTNSGDVLPASDPRFPKGSTVVSVLVNVFDRNETQGPLRKRIGQDTVSFSHVA